MSLSESELEPESTTAAPAPESQSIDYGVELHGVFDGVAFWVLKDGTRVNRFAGTVRGDYIEPLMKAWTP
jgi:hypothetical protein